jgi:D-amino-acid dehydrogenase
VALDGVVSRRLPPSVNRENAAHCCVWRCSARHAEGWREDDGLAGFNWRRNGKLVTFRSRQLRACAQGLADPQQQQVLSAAECAQLEPALADAPFVGAIYTPDEEVGDCHAFCQLWRRG